MLVLAGLMISCSGPRPQNDADIIVVGAGIAGLAAALDAGRAGADVLVLDANSVGGGHAVKAGGFALVGTELQAKRGHTDTPEIAFADLMAWGEDADPEWVRQYVELSDRDIHDWLTGMGVKFNILIGTPESQVPRFHFAGGRAVKAVVPMMQNALRMPNIKFLWNTRATGLLLDNQRVAGVVSENLRSGASTEFRAAAVILATGGFQSEMAMVRDNWRNDRPYPGRLLIGSGQFASGDGYRLAEQAGAAFVRMDHQVTFINGLPDPRTTDGSRALVTQNPAAIWVNADGRRFVNEAASSKVVEAAVFEQDSATHWLVFDERGKKSFGIRDAPWLSPGTVNEEILLNPALTKSANIIEKLAIAAGLPVQALITTVTRFNAQIESGKDRDFQRFGSGTDSKIPAPIGQAPFYAIQLFPTTRKSMGGPAIDLNGHALDTEGQSIPGLYAAGELTGVAGINGSHGGSGTFLGPSLLTGRIAGRTAAADLGLDMPSQAINAHAGETPSTVVPIGRDVLQAMIDTQRPGYWHFEVSHALVLERAYECSRCHDGDSTMTPAISAAQMLARLDTCTTCH
jgi:succinate dehydrogenase/fumarate reductase flavoprotein subunit